MVIGFWLTGLGLAGLGLAGVASGTPAHADPPPGLAVTGHESGMRIAPVAQILEDPLRRMTVTEARAATDGWRAIDGDTVTLPLSGSVWWVRFSLVNPTSATVRSVIDLGTAQQDYTSWYVLEPDGRLLLENHTGDRLAFDSRLLAHRDLTLPLWVPAGETREIYLRLDSHDGLFAMMPLRLYDVSSFFAASTREGLLLSLFHGGLVSLAVFNLLLFISTHQTQIGLYVVHLLAFLLASASFRGFTFQYLWPGSPIFHNVVTVSAVILAFVSGSVFVMRYVRLHRYVSWITRDGLRGLILLSLAGMVPAAFGHYLTTVIWTLVGLFLIVAVYLLNVRLLIRGVREARFTVPAFLALIIAVTLYYLQLGGIIPNRGLAVWPLLVGASVELMLLAYGLADSMNQQRERRFAAERQAEAARRDMAEIERRAAHAARHDELTALPNRLHAEERLNAAIDRGRPIALLHLALDNFRTVNESLGHAGGDAVLRQLARRLEIACGPQGLAARLLADEFAILLPGADSDGAVPLADQVQRLLAAPFQVAGSDISVDCRIGIAAFPADGRTSDDLFRRAAIAVQDAARMPGRLQIYQQGRDDAYRRRISLIRDLRHAADEGQFRLHYQPKIDIRTGQVVAAEALLRWQHPLYGMVSPAEFIPLAEHTGSTRSLTHWVLAEATRQLEIWAGRGFAIGLSVNISALDLQDADLVPYVGQLLKRHGVGAGQLTLEITESAVMTDPAHALVVLNALRACGVVLSVDDFGTGYSSLAHLKRLPVQELKIDQSFIRDLSETSDDAVIVRSTIDMSHSLSLSVVAEGVETLDSLHLLNVWGCDIAQGYVISRPLPPQVFEDWLIERQRGAATDDQGIAEA
ncbi:hypothetical protein GCM10011505_00320 [Tistrella bauzanensis]|uniref:Diguanylate cyclase/phosphodiesterase n=1 Tax=Tistrella bauzanensis TaxID=657419 RepID=A0ABQ1I8W7_9PROT|nr:EAL domain-containing protein [Tistrella bauzanensis]GGB23035.1 hypothetical protein GCM10011505_00320 [Tistrella bauzanensis]